MNEKYGRLTCLKHYFRCKRAAKRAKEQALIWSAGGDCYSALFVQRMADNWSEMAKCWKQMVIHGK